MSDGTCCHYCGRYSDCICDYTAPEFIDTAPDVPERCYLGAFYAGAKIPLAVFQLDPSRGAMQYVRENEENFRLGIIKFRRVMVSAWKPKGEDAATPIWEQIVALGRSIPEEEWANVPTDLARNLRRYL